MAPVAVMDVSIRGYCLLYNTSWFTCNISKAGVLGPLVWPYGRDGCIEIAAATFGCCDPDHCGDNIGVHHY